ncbi:ubiquinone/menaquinone biosynthesis methyltransferase subfamily protein [Cardiosporidium cionae]|uniref:2-methoxy-6-polyprenyl-1,4-benzoquinol methylase, mitochondrial n=1 Tax=Cardiosporidium cionae TaxID=476202 RepID=A0ABQ7J775_9APIC|nr:ubiquinone/menaquinone biosynthesis methyltransferase subfamily protein [Cardiosporidium cionae]|eukprot:KAF8819840.1 ubiquinone/menaquinone biosynthesis methyltransferase subfamily protein [Cardiosporidium cionae]
MKFLQASSSPALLGLCASHRLSMPLYAMWKWGTSCNISKLHTASISVFPLVLPLRLIPSLRSPPKIIHPSNDCFHFKNKILPQLCVFSHMIHSKAMKDCANAGLESNPHDSSSTQASHESSNFTDFGFSRVSETEKSRLVHGVFTNVAESYDLMNDFMSLGIQRLWKNMFVSLVDIPQRYQLSGNVHDLRSSSAQMPSFNVLDLAGGTGDIAFRILQKVKADLPSGCTSFNLPEITVCDINNEMLRVGKLRAEAAGYKELNWVCADGENLPFEDSSIDLVTIAFGIRNFANISRGLREINRILKPGGRFLCLEFSKVENAVLSSLYSAWSFWVIPVLGQVVTGDRKSYQYLVESIQKFPSQEEFSQIIWNAGFCKISYINLTGGIVSVHSAYKESTFPSE